MSKAGQRNYKGVNTQAKSALLLFLTHYYGGGFSAIVLEDERWEDYTLEFSSGKKIVCESKAWDKPISLNATIGILENIAGRDTTLNKEDEIFIVCSKTDQRLVRDLEYLKYELPPNDLISFKNYRKPEKLTPKIIELLKITKFFELPSGSDKSKDYLQSELVARFAHLISFWLPEKEMERFMDSVLIKQIYDKSEAGKTFTKKEFESLITAYRDEKIKNTGAFDSQKRAITKQMNVIVRAIKDKDEKYQIEGENLIALSAQPMHMYIALDLISQQSPLVLRDWRKIWDALIDKSYGFRVLHIFEKSINTKANASFIISFLKANIDKLSSPLVERHTQEYAIDVLSKVVKAYPSLSLEALDYLKKLTKPRLPLYWDSLSRIDLSYEKENVAKVLDEIYKYGVQTSSQELIESVINFIIDTFNIAEDDSEYTLLTPAGAYSILREWLMSDFYKNFPKLREAIINHYKKTPFHKGKFTGWELVGGMESGWSHEYKIIDHNFIRLILRPAFEEEYKKDRKAFWKYLIENLITVNENDVSENKPDFLTRAAVPIIVREYIDEGSSEALEVIDKSLEIHKGLIDRSKLIFIKLLEDESATNEQKWELVSKFLEKNKGLPRNNVFAEQLVLQLASDGNQKALDAIESWLTNSEYLEQQNRWHFYVDEILGKLLDDKNKNVAETAVRLLKTYLETDNFQSRVDKFDAWDIASLAAKMLNISPKDGLETLRLLYKLHKDIPTNIQIVITSPLTKLDKENIELIKLAYQSFVKPLLIDELHSNAKEISAKFTDRHAREDFVHFAELMIEVGLYEEGFKLVEIFINDPDPQLKNYPDDPEGTFNYHEKIKAGEDSMTLNTVRGWCACALQKVLANNGKGKPYIAKTIELVKRLSTDENYYVRLQSLIPLADLASNQHCVVAKGSKERLMSLKDAKEIEEIAFAILENPENQKLKAIMDRLSVVFSNMRFLTTDKAKVLVDTYSKLDFEKDIEVMPALYIFYAEFRKDAYKSEGFKIFGDELYKELNDFDDTYFKEFLIDKIKNSPKEIRASLAWHFWKGVKEATNEKQFEDMFELSNRYLELFLNKYDHYTFERLFHFAEDNIDKKPEECIELWKNAIKAERDYVKKNEKELKLHQDWWGRLQTDGILMKVLEIKGEDEFADCLSVLLDYPLHLPSLYKPSTIYETLKNIKSKEKTKLLNLFQEKYPHIYAEEQSKAS